MKIGIMQPYFLPYIGYWQMIKAVDIYVIYDDVQYIKGGWINRNNILLNGARYQFNLILNGASPNKQINEIQVDSNQIKLLRTIECAYKKAPYFDLVFPIVSKILNYSNLDLSHYVGNSIVEVCNYLDIKTQILFSSNLPKDNLLKGQDKVINICKLINADKYLNAIGGQELYSKVSFIANGISLMFLSTNKEIQYKQFNTEFIPWLSILDVMMFNSVEEINMMLDNYELI